MQIVDDTLAAFRRKISMKRNDYHRGRVSMGVSAISAITGLSGKTVEEYVRANYQSADPDNPLRWSLAHPPASRRKAD